MLVNSKIFLAGHSGLVGSAIRRHLESLGFDNIIFRTSKELDLRDQQAVSKFFELERPEFVFLAAARVGGIHANNEYPADFIYDNLAIQNNVIHSAYKVGVKKLLFLGSSCIYPKLAPQPIKEDYLMTGELEPTNEPYAVAKISGIKMCEAFNRQYGTNFISIMPTNLYGPGDNFDLETSHVLPALIAKFHYAVSNNKPEVEIWGSGIPKREFLYVDDLATACVYIMQNYDYEDIGSFINVGTGIDISISELAQRISDVVGFTGKIVYNAARPDGTPRKVLDVSRIHDLGWTSKVSLNDGLHITYEWYKTHLRGNFTG